MRLRRLYPSFPITSNINRHFVTDSGGLRDQCRLAPRIDARRFGNTGHLFYARPESVAALKREAMQAYRSNGSLRPGLLASAGFAEAHNTRRARTLWPLRRRFLDDWLFGLDCLFASAMRL
jgi:hypothetical protein